MIYNNKISTICECIDGVENIPLGISTMDMISDKKEVNLDMSATRNDVDLNVTYLPLGQLVTINGIKDSNYSCTVKLPEPLRFFNGGDTYTTSNKDLSVRFIRFDDNLVIVLKDSDVIDYSSLSGICISKIALGAYHACVIDVDGYLWVAGANGNGQLGLGDTYNRNVFTNTGILAKQVSCGESHTAVIDENNQLLVTGLNNYGQLGLKGNDTEFAFVNTGYLSKYVACGNGNGQLGLGDTYNRDEFEVSDLDKGTTIIKIACGGYHSIIMDEYYNVYTVGNNDYGQLGLGDNSDRNIFEKNTSNVKYKDISCGLFHTSTITITGDVHSTGCNKYGQLGINLGRFEHRNIFVDIGQQAKQIESGDYHTMIIGIDDNIKAVGWNAGGQLGLGDTYDRIAFTDTGVKSKYVVCGGSGTFTVDSNDSIHCAGSNEDGFLGLGDDYSRNVFTPIDKNISCDGVLVTLIPGPDAYYEVQEDYTIMVSGDTEPNTTVQVEFPDGENDSTISNEFGEFTIISEDPIYNEGSLILILEDDDENTISYPTELIHNPPLMPNVTVDTVEGYVEVSGDTNNPDRYVDIHITFPDNSITIINNVGGDGINFSATSEDAIDTEGDIIVVLIDNATVTGLRSEPVVIFYSIERS